MGVWAKSLQIFNCLCDNGKQSVRRIAKRRGFPKSSVHRLEQARHVEIPPGVLVVGNGRRPLLAYPPGGGNALYLRLTRGVGAETISEFFGRLRLETHVGCSPSALRG